MAYLLCYIWTESKLIEFFLSLRVQKQNKSQPNYARFLMNARQKSKIYADCLHKINFEVNNTFASDSNLISLYIKAPLVVIVRSRLTISEFAYSSANCWA